MTWIGQPPRDDDHDIAFHLSGPRFYSGTPIYIDESELLRDQARASLASRRENYPAWIERGRIADEDASRDIIGWELLAAEWEWIVTGEGQPPAPETLHLRRAAVNLSLHRIREQFTRGNRSHDLHRQAHLAMALEWHLAHLQFGAPAIHFTAGMNHRIAAEGSAVRCLVDRDIERAAA